MKTADAPRAGWYPDPRGGVRLRWWDGVDWTERYRSRPSNAESEFGFHRPTAVTRDPRVPPSLPVVGGRSLTDERRLAEEIAAQVRAATRAEVDHAADLFSARARAATGRIEPLISQYTNQLLRWLRIGMVFVVVVLIAWFAFEVIAKATFFEWLGDRIDNLSSS